jgi:hypothetical protein
VASPSQQIRESFPRNPVEQSATRFGIGVKQESSSSGALGHANQGAGTKASDAIRIGIGDSDDSRAADVRASSRNGRFEERSRSVFRSGSGETQLYVRGAEPLQIGQSGHPVTYFLWTRRIPNRGTQLDFRRYQAHDPGQHVRCYRAEGATVWLLGVDDVGPTDQRARCLLGGPHTDQQPHLGSL